MWLFRVFDDGLVWGSADWIKLKKIGFIINDYNFEHCVKSQVTYLGCEMLVR